MAQIVSLALMAVDWGMKPRQLRKHCVRGEVLTPQGKPAAMRPGRDWVLLSSAVKPEHKPQGRPRKKR